MKTPLAAIVAFLAIAGFVQGSLVPDPACTGTCTVEASLAGYTPPLLVLHNGSSAVWHSVDVAHVQRETSHPLGDPSGCFSVVAPGGRDSAPVQFTFDGTQVQANVSGITKTCENAVVTASGALVPYHCTLHANMRGTILVVP